MEQIGILIALWGGIIFTTLLVGFSAISSILKEISSKLDRNAK